MLKVRASSRAPSTAQAATPQPAKSRPASSLPDVRAGLKKQRLHDIKASALACIKERAHTQDDVVEAGSVLYSGDNIAKEFAAGADRNKSCGGKTPLTAGSKSAHRNVVQQKIIDAFLQHLTSAGKSADDFQKLAERIEDALYGAFAHDPREYTRKARSLLFNLNDAKNVDLRSMLSIGFILPDEVPHLSAEQMSSYEKLVARARSRKASMEEVEADWGPKHGITHSTTIFTCDRCGASNTTYFQLQTRSCDEPLTTYVMCLKCRERWKC